jgi:hypothetical protein
MVVLRQGSLVVVADRITAGHLPVDELVSTR